MAGVNVPQIASDPDSPKLPPALPVRLSSKSQTTTFLADLDMPLGELIHRTVFIFRRRFSDLVRNIAMNEVHDMRNGSMHGVGSCRVVVGYAIQPLGQPQTSLRHRKVAAMPFVSVGRLYEKAVRADEFFYSRKI